MRTHPTSASLGVIAATPPHATESTLRAVLRSEYGLDGKLSPLVSERDQNTLVEVAGDQRFVLKVANAAEDPQVTHFQIEALMHINAQRCGVAVPEIRPTLDGAPSTTLEVDGQRHIVRLVSFVPGVLLAATVLTSALADSLGKALARLGKALQNFTHAGEEQALLWDMQRASELRDIAARFCPDDARDQVHAVLDDFENHVLSEMPKLRAQVVHNDANPGNVLVDSADAATVSGFIDFGDMLRAPLVFDVAIAASYLRAEGDPLGWIAPLIAGYHGVTPLHEPELRLLYDLVRTRLATTTCILFWREAERGSEDSYLDQSRQDEDSARQFLARLERTGRGSFYDRVCAACSR